MSDEKNLKQSWAEILAEKTGCTKKLAAELVDTRATVPRDEVGGGVEHFAGVIQNDAGDGEGVGASPGAEAVGVHGFEVLEGFGASGTGGQERGESNGGKGQFCGCSVHVHLFNRRRNRGQA